MGFVSVAETAKKWGVSERSVRNYCAEGRVPGAFLTGKTWNVPEDAEKPARANKRHTEPVGLLAVLRAEERGKVSGGIYHAVQIELTYNSNHMEGSKLTHDQTRYIFETNTVGVSDGAVRIDDIVETANHFKCVDMIIENASRPLSEAFVKELHRTLKNGTSDARKEWFAVGDYKRLPNEVGGMETTPPEEVHREMKRLLAEYNARRSKTLDERVQTVLLLHVFLLSGVFDPGLYYILFSSTLQFPVLHRIKFLSNSLEICYTEKQISDARQEVGICINKRLPYPLPIFLWPTP